MEGTQSHPQRFTLFPFLSPSFSPLFSDVYLVVGSFQPAKKRRKPNGYWMNVENRRKFFSEFAQSKGFDPLDFHQWNQFFAVDVIQHQVNFFSPPSFNTNRKIIWPIGNCWTLEVLWMFSSKGSIGYLSWIQRYSRTSLLHLFLININTTALIRCFDNFHTKWGKCFSSARARS